MGGGAEDAETAWVAEQLVELGFSPGDAITLAEARADYRKVAAVIKGGCSHELALLIFAS